MELVVPAGNLEKLKIACLYGADAAYIGLSGFSLRAKADNFTLEDLSQIPKIKNGKKTYGAFNVFFRDNDLTRLETVLDHLPTGVFDAFIVTDPGVWPLFHRYFPDTPLHLSTQANCTNAGAAAFYKDQGFKRIILARELSLAEIEAIKSKTGIEIEVFVHGAICLAYSGRCFLSAYMAKRDANRGDCAHTCRWHYRVLEEEERPGEYFPIFEGDGFTSILSSKDLCLIDHVDKLRDAGVDAVKIEGRMKSLYYVAQTARAYRKAIDKSPGSCDEDIALYREELFKVSRREASTGFFFGREEIEQPTFSSYARDYLFMGSIGEETEPGIYRLDLKNTVRRRDTLEYIGFDVLSITDDTFSLLDEKKNPAEQVNHGVISYLKTDKPLKTGYLIRKKIQPKD